MTWRDYLARARRAGRVPLLLNLYVLHILGVHIGVNQLWLRLYTGLRPGRVLVVFAVLSSMLSQLYIWRIFVHACNYLVLYWCTRLMLTVLLVVTAPICNVPFLYLY